MESETNIHLCDMSEPTAAHASTQQNPYISEVPSYLDTTGNTPLIELPSLAKLNAIKCQLYGKCEFLNPGGSILTRKARDVVATLERERKSPESTNKHATRTVIHSLGLSGAMACKVNGYPSLCIGNDIKMEKYSNLFTAHGGFLAATASDSNSKLHQVKVLHSLIPNSILAEDVSYSSENEKQSSIAIVKEIKTKLPALNMIVCTELSFEIIMSEQTDFSDTVIVVATIGDKSLPSHNHQNIKHYQVTEEDALKGTRELIANEGLFCSIRGGAVLHAAISAIEDYNLGSDDFAVLILEEIHTLSSLMPKPVNLRPSTSPMGDWWKEQLVGDLPLKSVPILDPSASIQSAVDALVNLKAERGVVQCLQSSRIYGYTSRSHLESKLQNSDLSSENYLQSEGLIFKKFKTCRVDMKLGVLVENVLSDVSACIVVQRVKDFGRIGNDKNRDLKQSKAEEIVLSVVNQFDVYNYIAGVEEHHMCQGPGWRIF